jgi:hypothetical protein
VNEDEEYRPVEAVKADEWFIQEGINAYAHKKLKKAQAPEAKPEHRGNILTTAIALNFEFPEGYVPDIDALLSEVTSYVQYLVNYQRLDEQIVVPTHPEPVVADGTRPALFRQEGGRLKPVRVPVTAGHYDPQFGCGDCEDDSGYYTADGEEVPGVELEEDWVLIERCDSCVTFRDDYDAAVWYFEDIKFVESKDHPGFHYVAVRSGSLKAVRGW